MTTPINPYVAGNPVGDSPAFIGRADVLRAAGAIVVGIGAVVEKTFEGGRAAMKDIGVPIESLAVITAMKDGVITFAD